jgi:hypothetical protein
MTPDERDRLLRLEVNAANTEKSVERMSDKVDGLDAKMDDLLRAAHMGQGAWWLILRIGAVLTAVGTAGAFIYEKFLKH